MNTEEFGGLYFQYGKFCSRKLWLYNKGINTNQENYDLIIGKINQENYNKEEFKIGNISIDKIKKGVVYEYKKSNKHIDGSVAQLENYMYLLKNKYNIKINKGILKVKDEKDIEILYNEKLEKHYRENIKKIKEIIKSKKIPSKKDNINICKKCGYYEKCYI